ncbi:hypothetical protein [Nostoc sp.]|uniref:hypothetical protein n=1 Tax=Nostoc sp. TaxID=1180 RepID=UPI002FFCDCBA
MKRAIKSGASQVILDFAQSCVGGSAAPLPTNSSTPATEWLDLSKLSKTDARIFNSIFQNLKSKIRSNSTSNSSSSTVGDATTGGSAQ